MRIINKFTLLVFVGLFLASCAEMTKYAEVIKPTAKLTGTRLANISFDQADLVFDLAIDNQNPVAIDLAGLKYNLKVEDQSLVSGVTAEGLRIDAASRSTVQLPVTLKFDDLKKLPGELWKKDSFTYQLDTQFIANLPVIGEYPIPVSKQGELPVPKIPSVRLKTVNINKLSFQTADLVARVEINNPNAFDLGLSKLNYRLQINQQQWAKGSVKQLSPIPKKSAGTIDIPVNLDLLTAGRAAYTALMEKQPVAYQLTGDVTLDTGIEMLRNFQLPLDVSGKATLY
jgi:LEA14-like dessication related protein